jgi:hypothetical protein
VIEITLPRIEYLKSSAAVVESATPKLISLPSFTEFSRTSETSAFQLILKVNELNEKQPMKKDK